jgi:hypothetical protein
MLAMQTVTSSAIPSSESPRCPRPFYGICHGAFRIYGEGRSVRLPIHGESVNSNKEGMYRMSKHTETIGKQESDKKLAAVAEFVQKVGSLEKAKQAIDALTKLRKAA